MAAKTKSETFKGAQVTSQQNDSDDESSGSSFLSHLSSTVRSRGAQQDDTPPRPPPAASTGVAASREVKNAFVGVRVSANKAPADHAQHDSDDDEDDDDWELTTNVEQKADAPKLSAAVASVASQFKRLTIEDVQQALGVSGANPEDSKAPTIPSWFSQEHVEVMHRQGLKPPSLVVQYTGSSMRPFFQLFLPQAAAAQKESCLVARRKAKVNTFRFSVDPTRMTKKNNPSYIGKMSAEPEDPLTYAIELANGLQVAEVRLRADQRQLHVTLEMQNQFLNAHEKGNDGRKLVGVVQSYVQPLMSLQITSSKRTVMEAHRLGDAAATAHAPKRTQDAKYVLELDYPLTPFLAFAVICAVESYRLK